MPRAKKPKKSALKTAVKSKAKRSTKKNPTPKALETTAPKRRRVSGALTPQHRHFAREFVMNGGNGTQAALAAGAAEDENGADVMARRFLADVRITGEVDRLLTINGLDDKTMAGLIWEGVRSFKTTWVEDPTYKQNGGYRPLVSPDFTARAKYVDIIAKLRGSYAPIKVAGTVEVGGILEEICNMVIEKKNG